MELYFQISWRGLAILHLQVDWRGRLSDCPLDSLFEAHASVVASQQNRTQLWMLLMYPVII